MGKQVRVCCFILEAAAKMRVTSMQWIRLLTSLSDAGVVPGVAIWIQQLGMNAGVAFTLPGDLQSMQSCPCDRLVPTTVLAAETL